MKRFSSIRNLVLLTAAFALGGCFAQAPGPDDLSQTDQSRRAELVGVDTGRTPMVAHSQSQGGHAISGTTPLGGANMGPQPEPWTGGSSADGDPNGGPQPEPWKPHKIAPDPEKDTSSALAPKP